MDVDNTPASEVESGNQYDAFISYSHADRRAANRIHRFVERFRLPKRNSRLSVYLDETDIRTGALTSGLEDALSRSRSLIVCCSPSAANSGWVRKEIEAFLRQDDTRPVILIILSGSPEEAIPALLRTGDLRFSDLRRSWMLGWMKPDARVELVRAIATVSDVDVRSLIPWDAKRRKVRLIWSTGLSAMILSSMALFPFNDTREIEHAEFGVLEYCDIIDARPAVIEREESGSRDYVKLSRVSYESNDGVWLHETDYSPADRLLHEAFVDPDTHKRAMAALDMTEIRKRARERVRELEDTYELESNTSSVLLQDGFWLGEPRSGLFVALYAIRPIPIPPYDVETEAPPAGASIVGVAQAGSLTNIALIDRLYPAEPPEQSFSRKSVNLNDGLPIVVFSDEIWIGMPVRADGGLGGLWHSSDLGASWIEPRLTGSVASLIADTGRNRLLIATAPGKWNTGVRRGAYKTELLQTTQGAERSAAIDSLLHGSESAVQFCGFLSNGRLATRVDRKLYETGKFNLLSLNLDL